MYLALPRPASFGRQLPALTFDLDPRAVSRVTGATLRRAPELSLCPAARLTDCDWPGRGAGHVICVPARGRRSDHWQNTDALGHEPLDNSTVIEDGLGQLKME